MAENQSNVLNEFQQPVSGSNDNVVVFNGTVHLGGTVNDTATKFGAIVQFVLVTVTLAELNAGKVLVTGVSGKTITPLDFKMTVSGTFATGTSAELEDTNGTPVVVASVAAAGLGDGAVINETEANTTVGAGYLAPLTAGAGLTMTKTGSDFTGGTSITVRVLYTIA